jgi:hypothetical protein
MNVLRLSCCLLWPPWLRSVGPGWTGKASANTKAWGMAVDGFRPDRYDLLGAALCLAGVAVIMYVPAAS